MIEDATVKGMFIGLLIVGKEMYLKLDTEAVLIDSESLPEGIGYAVAAYSVFEQQYPDLLKVVFCFLKM